MPSGERILLVDPDPQRGDACAVILRFLGIEPELSDPHSGTLNSEFGTVFHASLEDEAALKASVARLRESAPAAPLVLIGPVAATVAEELGAVAVLESSFKWQY